MSSIFAICARDSGLNAKMTTPSTLLKFANNGTSSTSGKPHVSTCVYSGSIPARPS